MACGYYFGSSELEKKKKPKKPSNCNLLNLYTAFGRFLYLKETEMNIEKYLDELIKREGGYVITQQIGAVQPNTVLLKL